MKQTVFAIFMLLLLVIGISVWWFWRDMQTQLHMPLRLESGINYTIKPGMSMQAIGEELKQMGLMLQPHYLILEARRQGREGQIKAGEYHILPGTTPLRLLDQFVVGKVVQHTLTLLEGWTFAQVTDAVRDSEYLVPTLSATDGISVMAALNCPGLSPEGQFFPDTYHFPSGTTDLEFLRRAFEKMHQVLNEEWEQRADGLPYQLPYEALIMASIIEKETSVTEERDEIAGVFVRRLQRKMRLQTDPTVIYAIGKSFDGDIRDKDLEIDSPYNTYRYTGLPPTPIALAGLNAIRAALHPEDGNTLYFVAKGDGSHYFSDTLSEHNKAVAKYQSGRRNNNE